MTLHVSIIPGWRHRCQGKRWEYGQVIEDTHDDQRWLRCCECDKSVKKLQHGEDGFEEFSKMEGRE
jgi:hypothetical protein